MMEDPIAWAAHQWSLEEALGASHLSVGKSGGSYPDQIGKSRNYPGFRGLVLVYHVLSVLSSEVWLR